MNCWELFHVQILQQQGLLIRQQKTNEPNPLYALSDITQLLNTQYTPGSLSNNISTRVSPSSYSYTQHSIT
jgi:hypothetical protein